MSAEVKEQIKPYHETNRFSLFQGDCLSVLPIFPDCYFDSIVTDPPAGISFMGKDWDHHKGGRDQWVAWMTGVMRECLRVLKPGGHALVWAIPRTSHWTGWAIESAGFEVRDRVSHLFGSGFPKSLDVSKAIDAAAGAEREVTRMGVRHATSEFDSASSETRERRDMPATDAAKQWNGWGTGLKPACEDWWLARKPIEGTVAENVLRHGTGGLNIDGCRIETADQIAPFASPRKSVGGLLNKVAEPREGYEQSPLGRWPSNVIHDGSEEVLAGFPETESGNGNRRPNGGGEFFKGIDPINANFNGDSGSASRFFYCAKSSQEDRNDGLNGLVSILIQWPKCDTNTTDSENKVRLLVDTGSLPLRATVESGIQHKGVIEWSTSWFGNDLTALYQTECKSITRTKTNSITVSKISNSLMRYLTSAYMADVNCETANGGSPAVNVDSSIQFQLTTNAKTASVLGVGSAPSPAQFKISVSDARNFHSTVKPLSLMRYLCRLITPPGGLVLDPFMGSGSTGKGAMLEHFRFIGIELDAEYCQLAQRRIEAVTRQGLLFA